MEAKKKIMDMRVIDVMAPHPLYSLLILSPASGEALPEMKAGQFVQVAVPDAPHTFLRRPISINFRHADSNTLGLLIRRAGEGTSRLCDLKSGDIINLLLPLGNGFTIPDKQEGRILLVGGGVGIAPLYYLGREMTDAGLRPEFIVGARSEADLLELDMLREIGPVHITTDDGSAGEHGLVTSHSTWQTGEPIALVSCCGPAPMMKAVARLAQDKGASCEVSLENMMACGLGACLCCVEKTVKGNVCVCTEGPVFNTRLLSWLD